MAQSLTGRSRPRRNFGRIPPVIDMPNLIEVQRNSYDQFLNFEGTEQDKKESGLQAVFESVFPIKDFSDRAELHFVRYEFEDPKYDVDECQQRGMTYAAPLKVTLQLWIFDVDEEIKKRDVRDIKEQDVYMGDMPLMTDKGTFIINGTERVIVSQMHRSPGVFFDHDKGKTHSSGKYLFRRPRHSLSRFLARLRVRCQGHRARAYRPPPQAAGDNDALCARPDDRRDLQDVL